tara:strand:- start:9810 stop:10145 length:336 start_codon:yes stop_codon:yes gene_type:complete
VKNNGFFSIEALLSFSVIVLLIAITPINENFSGKDLFVQQKESDLLIIWTRNDSGKEEMLKDAELFLNGNKFGITINNEKYIGDLNKDVISGEIKRFDKGKIETIRLSVQN